MSRHIERDTGLEVDVTCVMSYRGEQVGAIVTMPDGYRYSLPMERMPLYFDIVTPQNIILEAAANMQHDRTEPLPGIAQPRMVETATDAEARLLRRHAEDLVKLLDEERANVTRLVAELEAR